MSKLKNVIRNQRLLSIRLLTMTAGMRSNKTYLSAMYRLKFRQKLNWNNPQLYNEKCNWLKLHYVNPQFITMVYKSEVKKYVDSI